MKKDTFLYLWNQGVVKAVNDVLMTISDDAREVYSVKIDTSEFAFENLYQEYEKIRANVRKQYFDVGLNDENLMDGHKICACITGALLNIRLLSYDRNENIPVHIVYSNYAIAFLAGIYILYLFLLSDYKRDGKIKNYNLLMNRATFSFPDTNRGHDSYVIGRIKTLALNDIYGNDFDILTYADMLFWIEKYNKDLIQKEVDKEMELR